MRGALLAFLLGLGGLSAVGCRRGGDPVLDASIDEEVASLGRMALLNAPWSQGDKDGIANDVSITLANLDRRAGRFRPDGVTPITTYKAKK